MTTITSSHLPQLTFNQNKHSLSNYRRKLHSTYIIQLNFISTSKRYVITPRSNTENFYFLQEHRRKSLKPPILVVPYDPTSRLICFIRRDDSDNSEADSANSEVFWELKICIMAVPPVLLPVRATYQFYCHSGNVS